MAEQPAVLSDRAKWLLMSVVAASAIALLLLAAESAVRLRQALKHGSAQTVESLYWTDPQSKLRIPIAGKSAGPVMINSLGFRGPEIAVPKPPGTVRIAFLGASTTFCAEVSSNEAVWAHQTVRHLERRFPGARFDYVNAAVPGYVLETMTRALEIRVAPLQPDVIVIYEAANDLSRELRELAVKAGLLEDARMAERSWLARYSLLWELAEKNLCIRSAQEAAERRESRLAVDGATLGEAYRHNLDALVREAQARSGLVAVATFSIQPRASQSDEEQRRAAASAFYYMPFVTAPLLIRAYARYNEIAREVARKTGALLIDGEMSIPGDGVHFTDTVHFTDAGSERMALRVAEALAGTPRFAALVHPERVDVPRVGHR